MQNKEKLSDLSVKKNEKMIKVLKDKIIKLGGNPIIENNDLVVQLKELNKQFEKLSVGSILKDKLKNIIQDESINGFKIRFQKVLKLPFKDLRKLIDEGKKELKEGIVVVYCY